jgi:hypothetical protein
LQSVFHCAFSQKVTLCAIHAKVTQRVFHLKFNISHTIRKG